MIIRGRITIGEWSTYDVYAFKDHEELEFCIDIIKGDLLERAIKANQTSYHLRIEYSIQVTAWQEGE